MVLELYQHVPEPLWFQEDLDVHSLVLTVIRAANGKPPNRPRWPLFPCIYVFRKDEQRPLLKTHEHT